jgi:hypothetical protein
MTVNPDPRPGRWILPLIVLGMVAFTYFFVQNLPAAEVDGPDGATTTTTVPDEGTVPDDGTTSTVPGDDLDPEVAQYLASVDALEQQLLSFQAEMAAINGGFDADPREVSFQEAEERLVTLGANVATWSESVAALASPAGLEEPQAAMVAAAADASAAADAVLEGLRSTDPGDARRAAAAAFDEAVAAFGVAADQAVNLAEAGAAGA